MRRLCALIAIAILGFAFGFAGCGEDQDGSPGGDVTSMTDTGTTDDDTTTNGTTDEDEDEDGGPDY